MPGPVESANAQLGLNHGGPQTAALRVSPAAIM